MPTKDFETLFKRARNLFVQKLDGEMLKIKAKFLLKLVKVVAPYLLLDC